MVSVSCAALMAVYMVVFIDFLQLTFLFPLFPKIVEDRPVGWCSPSLQIGLLGSVASVGEGVAAPYLGALADRVGRRPVFIIAILGCAVCSVITGLTETYEPLLVARLFAGVCGGTASVAAAYIADVTEPEERAAYMTYFQAALFGGLSFGPAIGGALDSVFDFSAACYASAAICGLNAALVFFFLPESKSSAERNAIFSAEGASQGLPCNAYSIFFANFLNGVGFTAFEALGCLYLQDSFFDGEIDPATVFFSGTICGVGVVGMIVNLFLYNMIMPCTGLKGSIVFGGFFSVVSFFCIGLPVSKYWFFIWVQVIVFGENVMGTSVQTVITCVVHPSMFGKALGTMTLFQNIARALGPFVFSPLFELSAGGIDMGPHRLEWAHSAPWFINSFLKLAAILLCVGVKLLPPEVPSVEGEETGDSPKEGVTPTSNPSFGAGVKRQLSRTTSGSFRTGGIATIARAESGTPKQKDTLLGQAAGADFREQSLQPVGGDQIAPEAAGAVWS